MLRVLDLDDLLVYWRALARHEVIGAQLGSMFEHVLVDEYQDLNAIQVEIVRELRREQRGLTVVGDDAQAIYGFRAASAEHILNFGEHFPDATRVTLERNYRSSQPILDLANEISAGAARAYPKRLHADREGGSRPRLVYCRDQAHQAGEVCERVLAAYEEGVALREQAVLMRAGHHSDLLELELGRRKIPFVKFGGIRYLEAAHVKDFVCTLRLADNPSDSLSWFRVIQLPEGIGPVTARRALDALDLPTLDSPAQLGERWRTSELPWMSAGSAQVAARPAGPFAGRRLLDDLCYHDLLAGRQRDRLPGGERPLQLGIFVRRGPVGAVEEDGEAVGVLHARTLVADRLRPQRPLRGHAVLAEQAALKGVADELGAGGEAQLLHDVRSVGLGCSHRDEQRFCDLLVGVAGSKQSQHLGLPRRERVGGGVLGCFQVGVRLAAHEPGTEHRMQVLASRRDRTHGAEQLFVGGLLQQIAARALLERLAHVGGVVVHREHENRRLRSGPLDFGRDLETAAPRHRDVKQDHVGLVEACDPHRFLCATGFVFDGDVGFGVEEQTQAGTDKRVVVDDQDANHNPTRLQAHNEGPLPLQARDDRACRFVKEEEMRPRTLVLLPGQRSRRRRSLKSLVERYLIGALGFAAAALWLGVGLIDGLECLLAFLLTSLVVAVVQRRRLVAERSHAHRAARGDSHGRSRATVIRRDGRPAGHAASRSRPSLPPRHDAADSGDWPLPAERW